MFDLKTLNDVMAKVTSRGSKQAMLWQDVDGSWKPITSAELYGKIRALAAALKSWGVVKGDRVALLSENRWEWAVTDFACFALGAVDVPLYGTLTPEQLGYSLRDSGSKVAVFSTKEQYEKLAGAGELPALERVVVMDQGEFPDAESFAKIMEAAAGLQVADASFDAAAREVTGDDLATLIYTSGTTGEPKGVRLTHGNIACNLNLSTDPFGFHDTDSSISFLPLSHVTARHLDYAMMCHGARIAYCTKFDLMAAAMKATKPTIFVGVPRVYEKIRQAVEGKSAHSPVKKGILQWAIKTGEKHRPEVLEGKTPSGLAWKIADKLVYSKIREAFGGCAHTFVSGGAPLGMDTAGWFADVGIRIFEGYGLTETSPVIALNYPQTHSIGTVGPVLKNVEVRFAADGELEVKGPSIFKGYWQKEKETAEAFTEDGWFKTGDIGKLENGYLSITDRKKELLKTSGGKLIAPQPVENKLKANTLVGQAAMVGDKHKFACVLISPNFQALEKWAQSQGVGTTDRKELVKDKKVVAEYQRIVDAVNKELPPYETMKRIAVVGDEWSVEDGEMTPSMKMKRRVIEKKYEKEIGEFYADEASATKS
ncbi:AMP-dependent synthetase/ligase [Granulicella tundricola]|uniref:AMP-dependent synthetase and ligase n=1 Tax=Granulicella tundricola (strain ATCC BAA-1859 / DSM 23138 / MP5ACTX9) TaxID=1198114 RepID=E8X046_GRATM|nr:long-chain fatty acid--CoA ligase [Granulicella tundricola]ADW68942.1 AMP-dependent synthetase and ligase [Granulicella tundricola MP5ACTX9]